LDKTKGQLKQPTPQPFSNPPPYNNSPCIKKPTINIFTILAKPNNFLMYNKEIENDKNNNKLL
jgi:hypothetical protein